MPIKSLILRTLGVHFLAALLFGLAVMYSVVSFDNNYHVDPHRHHIEHITQIKSSPAE